MKNILNEELEQMKYLFGYKRGVVISEQENQDELKIKYELAKLGGDSGQEIQKYFKDTLQGNASVEPEKRFLDLINAQYSKLTPEQKNKFLAKYNQTRTTGPITGELASTSQEVDGAVTTPSWDSNTPIPQKPETVSIPAKQNGAMGVVKKYNLPQLKSDVEKYEDTIMKTAPQNIKDELNKDRDNRSVGVSTLPDINIAKSKALMKGQINLAKKLGVNEIKTVKVIDATQDGQTFVVVAKA